ncbi:MAG: hypothetical protein KBD39_04155 [Sterolibacterium sp.]|nr:hypothetical protein [Sterolibacterium sp.]MBP9799290.1 hypothetical protein [Sterolibacterium sp.]
MTKWAGRWLRVPVVPVVSIVLAVLVTGCAREDAASYNIDGDQNLGISLLRETYPWRDGWDMKLVTTHVPECLRRHALKPAPLKPFIVELFQPEKQVFILRQGSNWYVTELGQCRLQPFDTPPPAPGLRLGAFVEKNGALVFVDEAGKAGSSIRINR